MPWASRAEALEKSPRANVLRHDEVHERRERRQRAERRVPLKQDLAARIEYQQFLRKSEFVFFSFVRRDALNFVKTSQREECN